MAPQKTPAPNKNAKKKAAAKSGTKTPIKKSKVASPKTTLESKKKMIKNLDAKKGGVSAFDMEAFVKVKFSALEKTAHQKKVMLETQNLHVSTSRCCRTCLDEPTALWRT